jgi:hypothetical protein
MQAAGVEAPVLVVQLLELQPKAAATEVPAMHQTQLLAPAAVVAAADTTAQRPMQVVMAAAV